MINSRPYVADTFNRPGSISVDRVDIFGNRGGTDPPGLLVTISYRTPVYGISLPRRRAAWLPRLGGINEETGMIGALTGAG